MTWMSRTTSAFAAICVCILCATASAEPHVSMSEARKLALVRIPGTVVHEKLKHEKNHDKGKHDHYNFKIRPRDHAKNDTTLKKVEIDAETGAVLTVTDVKAKSHD